VTEDLLQFLRLLSSKTEIYSSTSKIPLLRCNTHSSSVYSQRHPKLVTTIILYHHQQPPNAPNGDETA
jgi:hypothetical protein